MSTAKWRQVEDDYLVSDVGRPARVFISYSQTSIPTGWTHWGSGRQFSKWDVAASSMITDGAATWAGLATAIAELNEVASLPDNWNGYGESRVTQHAYWSAVRLITAICGVVRRQPAISPLASGGVQFDWGPSGELVVEIHPNGRVVAAWEGDSELPEDEWKVAGEVELEALVAYANRLT